MFPLSNGTVVLNHTARQYTITMSVHQLAVLLLFNDKETVSKAGQSGCTVLSSLFVMFRNKFICHQ